MIIERFDKSEKFQLTEFIDGLDYKRQFSLTHKEDDRQVVVDFPFSLDTIDEEYRNSDIELFFLDGYKKKQTDIYKVYDKNQSILLGWIVPLISLTDDSVFEDLETKNSKHFINSMYLLFKKILNSKKIDSIYDNEKSNFIEKMSLEEIYGVNTNILIVFNKAKEKYIEKNLELDMNQFILSLYEYGYFFSVNGDEQEHKVKTNTNKIFENLHLYEIADDLKKDFFLHKLFYKELLISGNEINRFFLLYQSIELLANKVHFHELKRICTNNTLSESTFFKIQEKLHSNYGEKLINKLTTEYVSIGEHEKGFYRELQDLLYEDCKKIRLIVSDTEKDTSFYDELYAIRNILFHAYHSVYDSNIKSTLQQININLERLLLITMRSFRIPDSICAQSVSE